MDVGGASPDGRVSGRTSWRRNIGQPVGREAQRNYLVPWAHWRVVGLENSNLFCASQAEDEKWKPARMSITQMREIVHMARVDELRRGEADQLQLQLDQQQQRNKTTTTNCKPPPEQLRCGRPRASEQDNTLGSGTPTNWHWRGYKRVIRIMIARTRDSPSSKWRGRCRSEHTCGSGGWLHRASYTSERARWDERPIEFAKIRSGQLVGYATNDELSPALRLMSAACSSHHHLQLQPPKCLTQPRSRG